MQNILPGKHKSAVIFISGGRILTAIFLIVSGCIIFLVISLYRVSPGTLRPFLDKNGHTITTSISEKVFVTIGGVKQGMFIRGKNSRNPVILFVHGGPAFSEYFLVDKFPAGLEDDFTICYWEQRGGGLSYSPDIPLESMTLEQFEADLIEVAHYLRERFGTEKIFLMAHSGGTAFAIRAAANNPQLFFAYIGISQITRQAESEKIAYRYMLEQYEANGNKTAIKELRKYPVLQSDDYILPFHMSLVRDKSMHELGIGTMRSMKSILSDVFIPVWTCRAYTLKEKVNIWIAKFSFLTKTKLKKQICTTNIPSTVQELAIPVYFFSGKYDLTVNVDLSREYLRNLRAPIKGFYTFAESAHSPNFEEPGKLKKIILTDVKNFKTDMKDDL